MKLFNSLFVLLRRHKKTLIRIFVVSTVVTLISSAVSIWLSSFHNLTLLTRGTIKTVGVEAYWDPNCKNKTETIDWGTIWLGSTQTVTLYLRSVSNVKTFLQLNVSGIIPTKASNYIDLSWDYDGTFLNPGETIKVTLSLSTSNDDILTRYLVTTTVKDFRFDIHIVAYE